MKTLQDAIATEREASALHEARCIEVWQLLRATHPALTEMIYTLFSSDTAAARWVCARHRDRPSPVEQIAAGEVVQVMERVARAQHGMCA